MTQNSVLIKTNQLLSEFVKKEEENIIQAQDAALTAQGVVHIVQNVALPALLANHVFPLHAESAPLALDVALPALLLANHVLLPVPLKRMIVLLVPQEKEDRRAPDPYRGNTQPAP